MEYLADLLTLFHSLSDQFAIDVKDAETLLIAFSFLIVGCAIGLHVSLSLVKQYRPITSITPNMFADRALRVIRDKEQEIWLTRLPEGAPAELNIWQDLPISDAPDGTKTIVIKRMVSSSSLAPTVRSEASININGKNLNIDPEHLSEILSLARSGQRSEAIRILQSRTPTGKEEASQLIEMLAEVPIPFTPRGGE